MSLDGVAEAGTVETRLRDILNRNFPAKSKTVVND